MKKQQKRRNKSTYNKNLFLSFLIFMIIIIGYMLFVTLYVDPKWDQRMKKELVPIEQVIEEGNQKDEGYRLEREKEIKEGEKTKCPDNYGEMIGGETNEQ